MLGTIISGGLKGLTQILADPALRRIFWRTLLLALVAYAIAGGLAWLVVDYFLNFDVSWLPDFVVSWLRGFLEASVMLGVIGLMWAIFPAVFTGLSSIFLDEAALAVEKRHYPMDAPGTEPAFWPSMRRTLQFTLLVVFINILLMPLYLVGLFLPPLNLILYYGVNGYFLGREYFELVGYRHLDEGAVFTTRRRNGTVCMLAGALIAFALTIPFLNLLVPVAAAAMMVHVYKELGRRGRIVTARDSTPVR
ncbi:MULTISPECIES: EI24 domain-containing protein [unclassified Minwuia]|jgi:CysZ protein|uniref:EI24 domain-containing protein n=1 Tax=unclassified Minwuia TaxID=2618799 RepID=UPI00247AE7EB|nr:MULTISPECIES: EI24 domain-containing protein [unclassified Minwuia]